jgi:hypothetical protein
MTEFVKGRPILRFCGEPTADGDEAASALRYWYETNRETWWERHRRRWPPRLGTADNFMIELLSEAERIIRACDACNNGGNGPSRCLHCRPSRPRTSR